MSTPSQPASMPAAIARFPVDRARKPANIEQGRELPLRTTGTMARERNIRRVETSRQKFKRSLVIDGFKVPPSLVPPLGRRPERRPIPALWVARRPSRTGFALGVPFIAAVSVAVSVALMLLWVLPVEGRGQERVV